jgi:hypothetical protein
MDLEFNAKYFETTPNNAYTINVVATCVDVMDIAKEVIDDLDAETIVKLFGDNEALLDEIGVEYVKAYFDLKETEED